MQVVIIFLLLALTRAAPQFQNQNSNTELDPVNDAAAQDEIKKLQQKRTLFGQNPYAYGPTKHIGVHPLGFKYLLGYGPIGYMPYAKPITYLKPILRTQGWKQILPHFKQVHFKPYFRRVKPHIVPVPSVQHVEPHVHEVPQVQVQPVHIQPHVQPIQHHYHQIQPQFHQVQPQVHAVQPLPVQPVQKPLVQVPQQYYYPFYRPLNVPNTVVPQIQQPFVPQGVQHLVPQAPIYQQVPQHPLIHQVPVQYPVVHQVQPNFIHQHPVVQQVPIQQPVVHQVPVQHPVVQQVPVQHPVVHQTPVQHRVVHQVQPHLVHQVPNAAVPNFSPNLPLNPALYHLLKQFQHIPQFKHITPLHPVNYPEHQPPIQYPTTPHEAEVPVQTPLHLPEYPNYHPNIYPEQPQPPSQYPVTTNDAGVSVQIPLHLPEHPNYRPNVFPDQSGSSDQDTTFPQQPDFQQGHNEDTFLVHNPNVPTHPAPQTPLYLPPHPNFRPGAQHTGSVEAGNSVQTELSATYPRQFPGNAGSAIQHPSITLEAPYGPGENLG